MKTARIIVSTILIGVAAMSCKKEKPTLARIQVLDTGGNVCPGAVVRLFGEPTVNPHGDVVLDEIGYTDPEGYAVFDFSDHYKPGSTGFAVLTIEVSGSDGLLHGEGIIKIEEEKQNGETVVIQP